MRSAHALNEPDGLFIINDFVEITGLEIDQLNVFVPQNKIRSLIAALQRGIGEGPD